MRVQRGKLQKTYQRRGVLLEAQSVAERAVSHVLCAGAVDVLRALSRDLISTHDDDPQWNPMLLEAPVNINDKFPHSQSCLTLTYFNKRIFPILGNLQLLEPSPVIRYRNGRRSHTDLR
jgi:hypothetical protein